MPRFYTSVPYSINSLRTGQGVGWWDMCYPELHSAFPVHSSAADTQWVTAVCAAGHISQADMLREQQQWS